MMNEIKIPLSSVPIGQRQVFNKGIRLRTNNAINLHYKLISAIFVKKWSLYLSYRSSANASILLKSILDRFIYRSIKIATYIFSCFFFNSHLIIH